MTSTPSYRNETDRREAKEAEVRSFIEKHACAPSELSFEGTEFLIVALSTKSPVVCALKSIFENGALPRASTRIILASLPESDPNDELHALAPAEIRWAGNPRLLDAHEQLVIGSTVSWTGDCMRRDPVKLDAFQCFNDTCLEAAGWARVSFERLWQASQPLAILERSHSGSARSAEPASNMSMPAAMATARSKWLDLGESQ